MGSQPSRPGLACSPQVSSILAGRQDMAAMGIGPSLLTAIPALVPGDYSLKNGES